MMRLEKEDGALTLSLLHPQRETKSVVSRTPTFLDGYCSTVQGLLDWLEVDLGFTELLFIQIDLCVLCVFVRTSHRRRTEYYYHSGNFKVMHTSDEAEVHTCLRMSHQLHTRV